MSDRKASGVILLGTNHSVQYPVFRTEEFVPRDGWSREFESVLRRIISRYRVRCVGEEATPSPINTTAAALAAEFGLPYKNLDIPLEVQQQIRVHPREGIDKKTKKFVSFEGRGYRLAWDTVREYHIYETFLDFHKGLLPSLLICGIRHQEGLRGLLGDSFEVILESYDPG